MAAPMNRRANVVIACSSLAGAASPADLSPQGGVRRCIRHSGYQTGGGADVFSPDEWSIAGREALEPHEVRCNSPACAHPESGIDRSAKVSADLRISSQSVPFNASRRWVAAADPTGLTTGDAVDGTPVALVVLVTPLRLRPRWQIRRT